MTEISITTKHKTLHRGLDDSGCIFYSTAAAFLIEEHSVERLTNIANAADVLLRVTRNPPMHAEYGGDQWRN